MEFLFDDEFRASESDSSGGEGDRMYAYAGKQHFNSAEVAALSSSVVPTPSSSGIVVADIE